MRASTFLEVADEAEIEDKDSQIKTLTTGYNQLKEMVEMLMKERDR